MKRLAFSLLISLSLFSCRNSATKQAETANPYPVSGKITEMNMAIQKAKSTFGDFKKAYFSHRFDTADFSIKVRLPTSNGGGEHFWISDLNYHNGYFWGAINDPPVSPDVKIKVGELFKIDTAAISDWEYIDDSVLVGGFTTRVLRKHMSPEEGRKFDSAWGNLIR